MRRSANRSYRNHLTENNNALHRSTVNGTPFFSTEQSFFRPVVRVQPKLTVNTLDDTYEKEADLSADGDEVMRMPASPESDPFLRPLPSVKNEIQPQNAESEDYDSRLDWFEMSRPFTTRGAQSLLYLDYGMYDSIGNAWTNNYRFFFNFGLGDEVSADAANFFTPFTIGAALKRDFPTASELFERNADISSITLSPTLFNFDIHDVPGTLRFPFLKIFDVDQPNPYAPVQRKCAECEAEEKLQRKPLAGSITPFFQRKEAGGREVNQQTATSLQSTKGCGKFLPDNTRSWMESRFGADFSGVRVHTDSKAVQLSRDLNAKAFTHGRDIYFNRGEFSLGTREGKRLLAHELTHSVQQRLGTKKIQKQDETCQQPSSEQIQNVIAELNTGISRMEGYVRNPVPIVGENSSASVRRNMRTYIRHTIHLAESFRNDLSSDNISFCLTSHPCPSHADACFVPVYNQFRVKPFIFNNVDRFGVAALLHEYKHLTQHQAHAQEVIQSNRALIHGNLDELNYEYEAALVGAIYSGDQINQESSSPQQEQSQTSVTPGELRERQGPGDSSFELYEERASQEVLEYASTHQADEQPDRSDLPNVSEAYESQIRRNSPVIHYPVLYRDNHLILRNLNGDDIDLGTFSNDNLNTDIHVERAFWDSVEATTYEQADYRRGILVIYQGREVINQIIIHSRPTPAGRPVETDPIVERPIRDITL